VRHRVVSRLNASNEFLDSFLYFQLFVIQCGLSMSDDDGDAFMQDSDEEYVPAGPTITDEIQIRL
jgi:hypothetical protein